MQKGQVFGLALFSCSQRPQADKKMQDSSDILFDFWAVLCYVRAGKVMAMAKGLQP
jgi:hypothetical protein